MTEKVHISFGLRVLAFICRICPCCIIARRWPDSAFARKFHKAQELCPFCRAYKRVIEIRAEAEPAQARPVAVRKGS